MQYPNYLPVKFSAVVVTYNEERHLCECLKSLNFCDQIVVADLGSTDASVEIAEECGADVIHHAWVPIVEQVLPEIITYAKNDWVVFLDPDEVLSPGIEDEVRIRIIQEPLLGVVNVPWQFYFRGKPLQITVWGREQAKGFFRHKMRNKLYARVHSGMEIKNGYCKTMIPNESGHYCKHYWADTYRQLLEKHWRYIKKEGEARYSLGERFSWRIAIYRSRRALLNNLFDYGGLKGGFTGIFLSIFYTWYVFMSQLSLRNYQKGT